MMTKNQIDEFDSVIYATTKQQLAQAVLAVPYEGATLIIWEHATGETYYRFMRDCFPLGSVTSCMMMEGFDRHLSTLAKQIRTLPNNYFKQ